MPATFTKQAKSGVNPLTTVTTSNTLTGTAAVSGFATGAGWSNQANITADDGSYASANLSEYYDFEVKLINSSGAITGNNKGTNTIFEASFTEITYGATNDLWGVALTPSIVNSSNFGVSLLATDSINANASDYLQASNFGFVVPASATILGVQVLIKRMRSGTQGRVDSIKIAVTYSYYPGFTNPWTRKTKPTAPVYVNSAKS